MIQRTFVWCLAGVAAFCLLTGGGESRAGEGKRSDLTLKELLGKKMFFDNELSTPRGQACAACHGPRVGWTGPDPHINQTGGVYEGAVKRRFGNRKPPTSAYATFSPIFHFDAAKELFVGGLFWDGRATGARLGSAAAEQAQGPFLNPLEQNMASPQMVCRTIEEQSYAGLFTQVFGEGSLDCSSSRIANTYDLIAFAIAAYEASPESSQFSSKFDAWTQGRAQLSREEMRGWELFNGKAKCAQCHPAKPLAEGTPVLFTDYTYDNLGIPKNRMNPFYNMPPEFNPDGENFVDKGLGEFLRHSGDPAWMAKADANDGKMKVPTVRNVAKHPGKGDRFPKAYTHNGYFKTLKGLVHFYNTRDVKPACADPLTPEASALAQQCWPAPEVAANVNKIELGNLGLTSTEEDMIVAFLKTLSDGFMEREHQ